MASFIGPAIGGLASGAAGALFGGLFGGSSGPKQPKFQRELIDQLIAGLQGSGPFANLFQADEEAFQRSIADPLMQQFQTQTAPGIQQKFIASGQQRGSPLESSLARAGLDVQGQIDQLFLPFQQQAQQNKLGAINTLLGIQQPQKQQGIGALGGGILGLLSSGAIGDITENITNRFNQPQEFQQGGISRRGF